MTAIMNAFHFGSRSVLEQFFLSLTTLPKLMYSCRSKMSCFLVLLLENNNFHILLTNLNCRLLFKALWLLLDQLEKSCRLVLLSLKFFYKMGRDRDCFVDAAFVLYPEGRTHARGYVIEWRESQANQYH